MSDFDNKKQRCYNHFRLNPNPTTKEISEVARIVDCSEGYAYSCLSDVVKANIEAMKLKKLEFANPSKIFVPKMKPKTLIKGKKKTPPPKPSPSFQKHTKIPHTIPKIDKKIEFANFCSLHSYPTYRGLYRWQIQWFNEVWNKRVSLTKVPRDHGKSIGHGNLCQWAMSAKSYDILYLGWTDRRKEVAQSIYMFFFLRDEIVQSKTTSPFHFSTIYGTKFDTYSVMSKEILGMHEVGTLDRKIVKENDYLKDYIRDDTQKLIIVIDDPIDDSFKDERHKEEKLERRYTSTISNINPDKLFVVGTHKFEGDFLHFIPKTEENCYIFMRKTHLVPENIRYNTEPDNPTNLLCPERWIEPGAPQYDVYDTFHNMELNEYEEESLFKTFHKKTRKRIRKLFNKKDIARKRKSITQYWWFAEYEQDPHPIVGEMWQKVVYRLSPQSNIDYDYIGICLDRATTQNKDSDETGIVVFVRHSISGKRLVISDETQKIKIGALALKVDDMVDELKRSYPRARVRIFLEKQGGGDDFYDLVTEASPGYDWANDEVIVRIHSSRSKKGKVEDYLDIPIRTGTIEFLSGLKHSKLITQILQWPHSYLVDAIDALAMGDFEMRKIPIDGIDRSAVISQLQQFRQSMYKVNTTEGLPPGMRRDRVLGNKGKGGMF